jgi:hypothetical protein
VNTLAIRFGARLAVIASLTVVLSAAFGAAAWAATKTWNNASGGPWTTAGNWTPSGAPLAGDVIQFSGGGTFTVTAVPTLSIQQLLVSSGSAVTLQAGGANTLTISGGTGTDLDVPSGTQLNVSGANALTIALSSGATGSIGGAMTCSAATHKLDAASAGSITFGSGATFTQGTGCTSNVFTSAGTANAIVFASGSSFIQLAGANPYGLSAPNSKVNFQTGSLFSFRQNSAPSFSNRTCANFEIDFAAYNRTSIGADPFTCDDFTMTAGVSHLQLASVVIKGDLSVAPGATLDFNPIAAAAVSLNGTSAQTVTSSGTLTFNSLANLTVGNAAGVTLQSAVTLPGTTTVSAGALLATAAALTNSGTTTVNGTLRIDSGGSVSVAPTYGGNSTLIYNASGGSSVGPEWSGTGGTAGAGVPQNVTVQQGTVTMPAASRTVPGGLTFNGGGMALASGDVTVKGVLALGARKITTGGSKVVLPAGASLTRSGGGYVVGNLQRAVPAGASAPTFEIGDATNYTPVALSFGSGTGAGDLTAAVTAAAQPNLGSSSISPTKYVRRYWTFTNSGVSGAYGATFQFLSGDLQGGADPAIFIVGKYDGSSWSYPTVGTKTSTSTQILGASGFSDFALGEASRWTITASSGPHGAIAPSGAVSVVSGDSMAFTITPDTGYHVDSLYVDGAPVAPATSHTFRNVTADHAIRATFAIDVFTIAASAGPHGSIAPSGAVAVDYGVTRGFTITPDMGYHVDSLYVDGAPVTPATSYTFTNVTADHAIRATFAIDVFTITASAGAHGTIDPSGPVAADYGTDLGFTITPDPGYHVDSLYVDGAPVTPATSYTFTNVTANHAIHATFAIVVFTIAASAGAHGSIAPSGSVALDYGAGQGFTITPATGYHVDSLYVDGAPVTPATSYTFTNVTANHTIHATFAIDVHTIAASAGAHGAIDPSGPVAVDHGSDLGFSITPDTGYHVDSLYVDGVPVSPVSPYVFTSVTADHAIHATFAIDVFTIVASAGSHGTIDPSGPVAVDYGANQGFTITPATGYHVDSLYVDGTPVAPATSHTFTNVTANHTLHATFAIDVFTIVASAGSHGSIEPGGSVAVNYGAEQGFTITPAADYHVDSLYVDGAPVAPATSYTFTNVTANHTLHATFAINVYTITASAGSHGSIEPSGVVALDYGAEQGFTITPDPGYHVDSLYVDGAPVAPATSYTFTNVTANHTLHATFAIDVFTITASAGAHGSIDPSGPVAADYGTDLGFTITPATGYHVDSLYVDGAPVTPATGYTFTNVTANHAIHATFAIDRFTLTATAGPHGSIAPPSASVAYGSGQAYTITPDPGYHADSLYVDGSPVPLVLPFSLTNVQADHAVHVTFAINVYTIAASAGSHGAIDPAGSVPVTHGGSQAFTLTADTGYHLDSLYVDGAPAGPVSPYTFTDVQANHTIRVTFAVNPAVPAITLLTAVQRKTGNAAGSTTSIHIGWPAVGAGATVEIYRAGFGNYPEYDDGALPGSVPPPPTAYPPAGRWVLAGSVAAPGTALDDLTSLRDFYYYVAIVTDRYGSHSPVSNMTTGTLNYHLADVADPADSLLAGDDRVDVADVSRFGAHYGATLVQGDRYNALDVGPTADFSPNTLPTTDNKLDFEDLVVFAMTYARVSAPQTSVQPVAADRDELLLESVDRVAAGKDVEVSLRLRSTGAVQGLATRLSWDPEVVTPVSHGAGALAEGQGALVLSARPGTVDAAVLGTGAGFRGEGVVATVTFRALQAGDPRIHLASADARDPQNRKVSLATSERAAKPLPTVTQLALAMPNPFRHVATLAFSLAQGGPVELAVFSVDGRRVRTLIRESREPGEYRVTWDGRDDHGNPMSAGIYYAHLKAAQRGFTRTLTYLR